MPQRTRALRQTTVAAVLVTLLAPAASRAATYTVTNLGTLGGNFSEAFGINNAGQVVGHSRNADGADRAFIYSGGTMSDVDTGGWSSTATAQDINASGQVVGTATPTGSSSSSAFSANGSTVSFPASAALRSAAYGTNSAGQIAGAVGPQDGSYTHAFLYSGGVLTELGTFGGLSSIARDINSSGQVVGEANPATGNHAFLYSGGSMSDLGTLGGLVSAAYGINDAGQIVGYTTHNGSSTQHAFLYSGGVMTDIGTLGDYSHAYDVNNGGQIVGDSFTASGFQHAFIYTNGAMTDLNNLIPAGSGWVLSQAWSINDAGQIVGTATFNGEPRAFLLTLAPEPTGIASLAIPTLAGLSARRRRSRA